MTRLRGWWYCRCSECGRVYQLQPEDRATIIEVVGRVGERIGVCSSCVDYLLRRDVRVDAPEPYSEPDLWIRPTMGRVG